MAAPMKAVEDVAKPEPGNEGGSAEPPILVVDVRKRQKRSRIRSLRKGKGRLLDRVREMVAELRTNNAIKADAQTIVLVVREREEGLRL
jgi:hypothetical protein